MSKAAAHVTAPTTSPHTPLTGAASTNVFIKNQPAWRALPAGCGSSLQSACDNAGGLLGSIPMQMTSATPKIPLIIADMTAAAAAVANPSLGANANPAAAATVATAATTLTTALAAGATAYAAAAATGGPTAGDTAFTGVVMPALVAFMTGSVTAISGGKFDMTTCTMSGPAGPHGPGIVVAGSGTVFINGLPAARQGDKVAEATGGVTDVGDGGSNVFVGD